MIGARLRHFPGVGDGVQGHPKVMGGFVNYDLLKHALLNHVKKGVLLNEGLRDAGEGSPFGPELSLMRLIAKVWLRYNWFIFL